MGPRGGFAPAATFQEALALLETGDARRARALLLRLVELFPRDPQALHGLGVAHLRVGDATKALAVLRRAAEVAPRHPAVLGDLGLVLHALGRFDDALASFDRALDALPDTPEIHVNRAISLMALGRSEDALAACARAIELHPSDAPAHYHRGVVLTTLGRGAEALASFDAAIESNPFDARFHCNRGVTLEALRRDAEALDAYRRAIDVDPALEVAHLNLGTLELRLGLASEAESTFARAARRFPRLGAAHRGRADALRALRRLDEALVAYDAAIRLSGDDAVAHNDRGNVLSALGRQDAALAAFDRAIRLRPGYAAAQFNKALVHLLRGEYGDGWRLYDAYWSGDLGRDALTGDPALARPRWQGDTPLEGRTVLVHCREGLGDFIQFVRYVPLLRARGARVLVEAPEPLVELFADQSPENQVVRRGSSLPDHDFQCPAMSLPHAFRTTVDSIPAQVPYLRVDAARVSKWRERLGERSRPRIGLAWSGRATHGNDHLRSLPVERLGPILELPCDFHCVQNVIRENDLAWLRAGARVGDHREALGDFSETAALIHTLDLVVSVDTSVAHLAGAIGKTVWILLPWVPDFRWMLGRSDSPWYPTATLFRQPAREDWESVVRSVRSALLNVIASLRAD